MYCVKTCTLFRLFAGVLVGLAGVLVISACAPRPSLEMDEAAARAEIRELEEQLSRTPNDRGVQRDLGSLYVLTKREQDGRHLLMRAFERNDDDPKTLFYLGLANERIGRLDLALQLYERYPDVPSSSPYRGPMRGRHEWVLREMVRAEIARTVPRCLNQNACDPAQPSTIAVLPLRYQGGDDRYAVVGRGLAELVSIDLASVRQLTVVERVRLQAVLDELALGQSGAVDPSTAPTVGRLLGAGKVVGGAYSVVDGRDLSFSTRLAGADGSATPLDTESARLVELFRVQKRIVFGIVDALGVQLTAEERAAIETVPTQNLQAFLAYSRGLLEEDRGNFRGAAQAFRQAAELDPSFQSAARRSEQAELLSDAEAGRVVEPSLQQPTLNLMDVRMTNMETGAGAFTPQGERQAVEEARGTQSVEPPPEPRGPLTLPPDPPSGGQ